MATNTYVALDKVTVGTATSYIEFTGINQGYTDLVLVSNYAGSVNDVGFDLRVGNSSLDTSTNYSRTVVNGDGTSAQSSRSTSQSSIGLVYNYGNSTTLNKPNFQITNLMNYSNATTYKSILVRSRGTRDNDATDTTAIVGLWRSTSAINIIRIYPVSGNILSGSTFSLYGIKAEGASGTKATGGAIYSDSTYYYHVFASTGTFTPTQSITADVFCVAGGGGAGRYAGGGGGAGGVITFIGQSLTATGYTCTVGAGGAASPSDGGTSGDGVNSSFGALTVAVGGGGGGGNSATYRAGRAGGSGGGGGGAGGTAGGATTQTGTGATNFYGYAGNGGVAYTGAGGGGAGGTSPTPVSNGNSTGNGGVGISSSFINAIGAATGTGELLNGNYYFAGGGYGFVGGSATVGTGGIGGGGGGPSKASTQAGANGVANLGGGGGTDGTSSYFGSGGSGIVIVRYAK